MVAKRKSRRKAPDTLEKLLQKEHVTHSELKAILASARAHAPGEPKKLYLGHKHIKYGYFSDAHIGNKAFKENVWELMCRHFKAEGVDFIVDAGDHLEGMSGRPGHIYELTHIGFAQQMKHSQHPKG